METEKEKKIEDCIWIFVVDATMLTFLEFVEYKSAYYFFENNYIKITYCTKVLRTPDLYYN